MTVLAMSQSTVRSRLLPLSAIILLHDEPLLALLAQSGVSSKIGFSREPEKRKGLIHIYMPAPPPALSPQSCCSTAA